jgi:hypothetical protein
MIFPLSLYTQTRGGFLAVPCLVFGVALSVPSGQLPQGGSQDLRGWGCPLSPFGTAPPRGEPRPLRRGCPLSPFGTAPPKGEPRPAGVGLPSQSLRDSSPKGGAKTCGGRGNPSAHCGGHLPFQGRRGFWTRVPYPNPLSPLKGEMSPQGQRGFRGPATLRRARALPLPKLRA